MKNEDMLMHVRGVSRFIDDIPAPEGCLHAVLFTSPAARGRIKALDISKAAAAPGVAAVYTHKDVPGLNQVGHIMKDQPLLAVDSVEYIGQPIALVVADSPRAARRALKLIQADIEPLPAVFSPREAAAKGLIHGKRRERVTGDLAGAYARCKYVAQGSLASGPQEHFYFETQRALAVPGEHDTIKVHASAQSPGAFPHRLAQVPGLPMPKGDPAIPPLGRRIGRQGPPAVWITAPALAAFLLKRPVKLVLTRNEDIATTGKRHAYEFDYKLCLDAEGKILAYEVDLYQHAGACADISPAVLGRSFLHVSGSYNIPNLRVSGVSCRTNIPPNNAFRGFGVPQGTLAIEAALTHAAELMGVTPEELKRRNLLRDGDTLPYGREPAGANPPGRREALDKQAGLAARREAVAAYNASHTASKKGLAVVPVCFGISFAQTALNQASALVHIYVDGSVSVSTGAVEMGQGVNAKIRIVAARTLGIPVDRVRVDTTNTSRIPNASPTSASTGADLNGMATKYACERLRARLLEFAARHLSCDDPAGVSIRDGGVYVGEKGLVMTWEKLAAAAQWARVDLGEHAFYATPNLHYSVETEQGRPFAYYSYGASLTEVKLDCERGTYTVEAVEVVQDAGESLSPEIDLGQVQGAVVQGLGWATMEQLRYAPDGRVLTGANGYKVPDIKFVPARFEVTLLKDSSNPYAVCNSKAIGEPPLVHGLGAYLALVDALRSVRRDKPLPPLPVTPERAFMYLHAPEEGK